VKSFFLFPHTFLFLPSRSFSVLSSSVQVSLSRLFLLSASLSLLRLLSAFSSVFCLLLLPFVLYEPSAQERSTSLLAQASTVCFSASASPSHQLFSPPPTSLLPFPLICSRWGWVHDITCGKYHAVLRELSVPSPPALYAPFTHPMSLKTASKSK